MRHAGGKNRVELYIYGHHLGIPRNEKQLLPVAFPPWALSAVDGHPLWLQSARRHRLNVDFIPARLIGCERDEFAVGRDSALKGPSILSANRNRLLASVQRKENHSARSPQQ